jgi:uncharacterized protein (TIGR02246 family)
MTSTTTTAGTDADRQAIRDVLADLYKAWAAGDAEAFVADYTVDATVVQPGVYKKDREEIRTTMAAAFAGPLSGSRATDHPSSIRFLTGDTAIVISEGGIIFPGQDAVASEGRVRRPGCWPGATAAGGSPLTTTAPPARASTSRCGAFPSGEPPRTWIRAVPGPYQRWHGRDRRSRTVWT